jgi:hypothetical protein
LLAHGRWFSSGTPASSTTKTGRHDIAEILLKVKHDKHEVTRRSQESAELPDVPRLLPITKQENKLDWLSEVPETRTSDVQLSFNDDDKGTLLTLHNYETF